MRDVTNYDPRLFLHIPDKLPFLHIESAMSQDLYYTIIVIKINKS